MASTEENREPKARILIVDDTPANLRLLMQLLASDNYIVHPASDGVSALRFMESKLPDIILLDIVMPGMDGFQVCGKLKKDARTQDIPIIFISSADQVEDKIAAFSLGGVDYITKPFQPEEVLARIATHVALRNLTRNLEREVQKRTADLTEAIVRLKEEIIERTHAQKRIQYMASHDVLTGLANRDLLEDRISQAVARLARNRAQNVAVIVLDLDHFKHVNDSLGHAAGDRLLQKVADGLQSMTRDGESVARVGADEFVLILPQTTHFEAALMAQRILDLLDQPLIVDGNDLQSGGSIGISLYPDDGAEPDLLISAADAAMHLAKQKGRGNYQFYTASLNDTARQRLAMINRLRHALAHSEFAMHYQPQVDIVSGKILSVEALIRWTEPGVGLIPCNEFIPLAEEIGLIVPIGEWALREACKQAKRWHDDGFPHLRVAVNVSARQCFHPNFHNMVVGILHETGLRVSALELEITESVLMQPNSDNVNILRNLSELGVQVSIDDFGTGYSSLSYLKCFPVSTLKIDQSFVSGIGKNQNDAAIVSTIIAMAHNLNLQVVAEGVETQEQAAFLGAQRCDIAQGYLYSRPVVADALLRLLQLSI